MNENKYSYMKNSNEVAKLLTVKLKRRVRASHIDEAAEKMGKDKITLYSSQTNKTFYFDDSEIEQIEKLL